MKRSRSFLRSALALFIMFAMTFSTISWSMYIEADAASDDVQVISDFMTFDFSSYFLPISISGYKNLHAVSDAVTFDVDNLDLQVGRTYHITVPAPVLSDFAPLSQGLLDSISYSLDSMRLTFADGQSFDIKDGLEFDYTPKSLGTAQVVFALSIDATSSRPTPVSTQIAPSSGKVFISDVAVVPFVPAVGSDAVYYMSPNSDTRLEAYGEWQTFTKTLPFFALVSCNGSNTYGGAMSFNYEHDTPYSPTIPGLQEGHYYQVDFLSQSDGFFMSDDPGWEINSYWGTVDDETVTCRVIASVSDENVFLYEGTVTPQIILSVNATAHGTLQKVVDNSYMISGSARYDGEITVTYRVREVARRTSAEIQEDIKQDTDAIKDAAEETKETTKGIFASIKEFFAGFFDNLINSVIGLFVPSTEEMGDLFGQLNDFFSDRFGFLYAPFDYMIQLLGVFTSSTGTTGITLPGFSIMGYEVWPDMTYDLSSDPLVGKVLEYVRIGTGVLLAGYFIMFLQDFFKERFGSE